jgi:hypothetical protein
VPALLLLLLWPASLACGMLQALFLHHNTLRTQLQLTKSLQKV